MKKIAVILLSLLMIVGCTTSNPSSSSSESVDSIRVKDGVLQYVDENGNWMDIASIETLRGENGLDGADGKDGVDGKDGINGLNGTNGINGVNGLDGVNGVNGTNGKDGINGTNGKDGINGTAGTIVTVSADGELYLDGVPTGFLLVKMNDDSEDDDSSSSESTMPVLEPCFHQKIFNNLSSGLYVTYSTGESEYIGLSDENRKKAAQYMYYEIALTEDEAATALRVINECRTMIQEKAGNYTNKTELKSAILDGSIPVVDYALEQARSELGLILKLGKAGLGMFPLYGFRYGDIAGSYDRNTTYTLTYKTESGGI
ncbi:MAG: hypothetical protein HUJ56_12020, partial [Erysipelotrichaceae bacterium]|nr:hypothetical protein [Erysipelotrichaceae bacterium]